MQIVTHVSASSPTVASQLDATAASAFLYNYAGDRGGVFALDFNHGINKLNQGLADSILAGRENPAINISWELKVRVQQPVTCPFA